MKPIPTDQSLQAELDRDTIAPLAFDRLKAQHNAFTNKVADVVEDVVDDVDDVVDDVADAIPSSVRTDLAVVADSARRSSNQLGGLIRRYPVVALAAVVAAGFLLGRTVTRRFT